MIELNTGVPGAGKTLSMVERLAALVDRWKNHPEEARPIFVCGIPDLALPHAVMPLMSVQVAKAGAPMLVPDWEAMPDGSLVIIDEAQGCFPPRSSASIAPAHVAWLNTHRHRGFDIWLTTQHPKLIDGSVRALVGKHQHYRRMLGRSCAMVYEWDACSDSLSGLSNAVSTLWWYPRKVYRWYKSAEIHTKQKFRLPKWLVVFPLAVWLVLYFVPRAYSSLAGGINGKGLSNHASSAASSSSDMQVDASTPANSNAQFTGYFRMGQRCFGILKAGDVVEEPLKCRENLQ